MFIAIKVVGVAHDRRRPFQKRSFLKHRKRPFKIASVEFARTCYKKRHPSFRYESSLHFFIPWILGAPLASRGKTSFLDYALKVA
jgi:hypothetical protein